MRLHRALYPTLICIIHIAVLLQYANAQPVLNFKRIANNWPTIELYFSVVCNGNPLYSLNPDNFRVFEDGREITAFQQHCPDPAAACKVSIAMVFDASGSMIGPGNQGAKDAGKAVVDSLDGAADQAAVLWFTNVVTIRQPMTTRKDSLYDAVNAIPASGATAIWDGIYTGVQQAVGAGTNPCRAVIALTDGGDNASTHNPADCIALAVQNRIRIYTVGLGSGIQSAILKNIADLTGGRYFETTDPSQLPAIYREITSAVRIEEGECRITYQSSCKDGAVRAIDLSVLNACGGSDTKTKTYKAAKDTADYTYLALGLGTAAARGNQEVKLPLYVMDTLTNEIFHTAVFNINFDTCLQFKEISAPAGSLLEGVPFSVGPAPGSVTISTLEKRVVTTQTVPRLLAELTFTTGNPAGADPVTCPVELAGWVFSAGCFRPVLYDGEITITPRRPDVICENQLMPLVGWEKSLDAYSPVPVPIAGAVKNLGDGTAEGFRLTIIHDDADFILINPSATTQNGSPAAIAPAGSAGAKWDVRIHPRAAADSVVVQFLAEFNNHPAVLCANKLFIPASVPVVKAAGTTRFCLGDSVRLYAVPGYAGYAWSDGSGAPSTVAKTDGLYYYTARDAGGRTIQSDTIIVRVYDPPVPEISPQGPITLCEGSSIQLGTTSAYAGYLWSTGEKTRTITVSQAGSYSVTVVDDNGCAGSSSPVAITVVPGPRVGINGAASACAGSTHSYAAGGTPNLSYRWSVRNGRILRGQGTDTAVVEWGTASRGVVVVNATDTVSACSAADSLAAVLHSLPRPVLSHSGDLSLCEGDSVVLDAGTGYAAYDWSNGAASASIVVSAAGSYFVEVTDANGCTGMSDTVFISITKRPMPDIQGPLTVCRNTQAAYTTSGKADTIKWEVSGGTILSGGRDSTVTVAWGALGSAWISVTALLNGCEGSRFENVALSDSLKPVVSASGPLRFCEGGTVLLDAGAGYVDYQWSDGSRTRTIVVSRSGSYSVYAEDAAGCAGTSDPVIVAVHPLPPEPVITRSRDTLFAAIGPYAYQWSESGAPISGATGRTLLIPAAGAYTVTITDSNGCGSTSKPYVVPALSAAAPVPLAFTFELYPDPNNGTAQLRIHTDHPQVFDLVLTDCLGRAVSQRKLQAAAGSSHTLLDLSSAPPGVYMLRIISGEGTAMRKLLRL